MTVLVTDIRRMVSELGLTMQQSRDRLADTFRASYAELVDREFRKCWDHSVDAKSFARALDLGHQVAALWALTDDSSGRAETIYRQLLQVLKRGDRPYSSPRPQPTKPSSAAHEACSGSGHCFLPQEVEKHLKIARQDRTVAALVRMLVQQGRADEARAVVQDVFSGKNPCFFQGISVAFLERFVRNHHHELRYLSTDAVVERLIKPWTASRYKYDPRDSSVTGRTFFECIHPE